MTENAAEPSGPAEPADLPVGEWHGNGVPAYDTSFGLEPAEEHSWVPQRSASSTSWASPASSASSTSPASPAPSAPVGPRAEAPVRTVTLGGAAGRALGARVQPWHVVAAGVGVLIPVGFILVSGLVSDFDPIDRPVASITRNRPVTPRTFLAPTSALPSVPVPQTVRPTRSVMTAPPPVVTVPPIPVTPVPTDATTIRFETYAEGDARIEVSLSDARHQRYDYPVHRSPLAFETRIDKNVSSNDYYSLRVRLYDPTGSGDRGAVSCRILVGGVVVTSQQGRGYATCYISPYYDVKRP